MSEKSRLIKNPGLIAIGNFGAKMVSFLLLPLYTSILTTEEYGTYDFIVAVSAFLAPIATMSMQEAMFRFIIDSGNKGEEFKKIVTNALSIVLMGIFTLGVVLFGVTVFWNLKNCQYIWIYISAGALYSFSNNILRGLGRIKEYAIVSSTKNIMQLILNVLVVAVFRWGMTGLLFSMCVSEVIAFLVVAIEVNIWKEINFKYISSSTIKPMLKYSLPLIPNALCAQIINMSDRLVISGFMGTSANGIYSVSYKFPNMIETVYHYFYTAWSESASRVFTRGKEKAEEYYQSLHSTISDMMFSVIILMIAGMPIMFRIFVRGDYVKGYDYIWILLLAMYFDCLAKFYSGLFTALKKTDIMAVSTLIAAIINLVVNISLIKIVGLYAAAVSTLLADMVLVFIRKIKLKEYIQLKSDYKEIVIKIIIAVIVIMLGSYNNWLRIGVSIIIAAGYAAIVNKTIIMSVCNVLSKKILKK